ncbi:MFS transporter [Actinosynnema sp. NPDC047251]|uniref:Major facilitator superfamily (MFS) profile domain-containing protein n=1 Tax=Saccharothrix espanaensis (strain ATCC 51144 / DSM 44229 / JCM 9112 / NBRC 15066 / NRRL 15764) TaxID=1179773 RepID=K0K4L1_SACES|nr:MFS transporter [Saccharothrix espanaensis]CCH31814.1 hypothetical protein BN6_45340 [Saccharothrix espanaensis DSM 44229]
MQSSVTRTRVLGVLAAAQVLGGIGVATGIVVGALAVRDLSGSDALAGLAQPSAVLGAALFAVPAGVVAARAGRRLSLAAAHGVGALGALLAACSAAAGSWPFLLVGLVLFGSGTTAILAARFAAADDAPPGRRARDLSLVVWATTVGSVLGPNLAAPGRWAASALGLAPAAGPFLVSALAYGLAALTVLVGLDRRAPVAATPVRGPGAWRAVRGSRPALVALTALVVGQAVMFGVMSMTPVHMGHGAASLTAIGLVMSLHIAGMYALSPLVGWAADRRGRRVVLAAGAVLLTVSGLLVAGAHGHDLVLLAVGLTVLGIGWCCGLVAGSALLGESVPAASRATVQGFSDMVMNVGGALGGVAAGAAVTAWGYRGLGVAAAVVSLALLGVIAGVTSGPPSRTR